MIMTAGIEDSNTRSSAGCSKGRGAGSDLEVLTSDDGAAAFETLCHCREGLRVDSAQASRRGGDAIGEKDEIG